jgi:acetyl esterase/lipase
MSLTDEMVAKIRSLGRTINPPPVFELYAPILARQPKDGVTVASNLKYGPHERNVLDVYAPANPGEKAPVLVFFHGGAWHVGDKIDIENLGYYFARAGIVTVAPSYRLAPEFKWPACTEDAAAAMKWVRDHIAEYGGDAGRIFLGGHSAGAQIAADYALRKRFQPTGGAKLAGLLILGGVFDVELEMMAAKGAFAESDPTDFNHGYFGTDPSSYREQSVVMNIDAPKLPVFIAYGERDPVYIQIQNGEMFAMVARAFGEAPALEIVEGHNHISTVQCLNTEDESFSRPMLAFIRKHS